LINFSVKLLCEQKKERAQLCADKRKANQLMQHLPLVSFLTSFESLEAGEALGEEKEMLKWWGNGMVIQ